MNRFVTIVVLILPAFNAFSQQRTESIWQTVQLPVKLNQKLSMHNDAGYRTLGTSTQPRQMLIRTGFRYHFSKKADVAGGIALFFTKVSLIREEHEFGREFRLWQEMQQQLKIVKRINVMLRLRSEQRFFESTSFRKRYDAYRFRYRATFQHELNERLQLQAGFEYMHQFEDGVSRFNQYRVQPSILWKINNDLQLQTMYMIVKTPNELQRALWLTWIYNMN